MTKIPFSRNRFFKVLGAGANPQFFTNYKTMLFGTDPVAMDRIAHEIVVQ